MKINERINRYLNEGEYSKSAIKALGKVKYKENKALKLCALCNFYDDGFGCNNKEVVRLYVKSEGDDLGDEFAPTYKHGVCDKFKWNTDNDL